MTSIDAVAVYLPYHRESVADLADQLVLTAMQVRLFRKFLGFAEVRRDRDGTLADLLYAAAAGQKTLPGREHLVRYVVHASNLPVAAPYPHNPLHEVSKRLGLGHALAFTITNQACAAGLIAIDAVGRLLAADGEPGGLALVLAGEKAFTRDAQLVPGMSIFGEAGAACLVAMNGERDRLLSYACRIRGEFDGRLEDRPELASRYEEEYPESLAEVMMAAVGEAGLRLDEISLILPHNVNAVSWQRMSRRIAFPIERVVLDNVPVTGHAFCADMLINYATAMDSGLLRPGDRYLVAAAGTGATFAAMVFEH